VFSRGRGQRRPVNGHDRGQLVDNPGGDQSRVVDEPALCRLERLDVGGTERRSQRLSKASPRDAVQEEVRRMIHIENLL